MTGLPTGDYLDFADERVGAARRALEAHVTSAYTGVCLGCGRPGPCADRTAALDVFARYGPAATAGPDPTASALVAVAGSLTDLRATATDIVTAADQAGSELYGVERADRRLAVFHRTIVDAWAALGEVYAGLHAARDLPEAPAGEAERLLAGLRAARDGADRAAALAATTRLRLTVAADLVRRTRTAAGVVAARRFTTAIARLDLVTARLAVGGVALDRCAAALTHAAGPPRRALPAPPRPAVEPPPRPPTEPVAEISAGACVAGRLATAARRRRQPGLWARVRHQLRAEVRR